MRLKKLFFIFLLAFAVVLISAGCDNAGNPENSEAASSEEEIEYTEDYYDRLFLGEVVTEEEKRENIFAALVDININTEFFKQRRYFITFFASCRYFFAVIKNISVHNFLQSRNIKTIISFLPRYVNILYLLLEIYGTCGIIIIDRFVIKAEKRENREISYKAYLRRHELFGLSGAKKR